MKSVSTAHLDRIVDYVRTKRERDVSLADGFVEGETLECWAHGSAFSLRTGRPLNLPAYEPVPVYEVTIDGDDILIDPAVTKDVN